MILDANQFYDYDVGPYLPFIENTLIWFDAFYQQQQQLRDVSVPEWPKLIADDDPGVSVDRHEGQ